MQERNLKSPLESCFGQYNIKAFTLLEMTISLILHRKEVPGQDGLKNIDHKAEEDDKSESKSLRFLRNYV